MNKVILMGRLVKDPDIRVGADNSTVARYTLAVDRRKSKNTPADAPTADFISCVSFGYTAEFIEKYTKQGTKLVISGRIQTSSYTDKDGKKVYTTDVVVDEAEFAESKKSDGGEKPTPAQSTDGFVDVSSDTDEFLPFK